MDSKLTYAIDILRSEVTKLTIERDAIKLVLKNLVDQIDSVHNDSRYQSVWMMYNIHGGIYNGPFYKDEMEAAKDILNKLEHKK